MPSGSVAKRSVAKPEVVAAKPADKQLKVPTKRTPNGASPAGRQELARQLLGAFQGDIRRVRVPLMYRMGILLTAVVMIILPAVYVAVIAAAAWAVYYHAANHTEILEMGTGRARIMALGLYVGPIIAGGIMVLFMLKPLFARPVNTRPHAFAHSPGRARPVQLCRPNL